MQNSFNRTHFKKLPREYRTDPTGDYRPDRKGKEKSIPRKKRKQTTTHTTPTYFLRMCGLFRDEGSNLKFPNSLAFVVSLGSEKQNRSTASK